MTLRGGEGHLGQLELPRIASGIERLVAALLEQQVHDLGPHEARRCQVHGGALYLRERHETIVDAERAAQCSFARRAQLLLKPVDLRTQRGLRGGQALLARRRKRKDERHQVSVRSVHGSSAPERGRHYARPAPWLQWSFPRAKKKTLLTFPWVAAVEFSWTGQGRRAGANEEVSKCSRSSL